MAENIHHGLFGVADKELEARMGGTCSIDHSAQLV
jgi:hypothetical protein